MPTRRTRTARSLPVIATSALLAAAPGCHRAPPHAPAAPVKVVVAPVSQESVPITMEFSSTLQSIKTVQFVPRVTGYIMERTFEEGAAVRQGDLLYQIDPRPFEAQLEQHEAQLEADQAHLAYQSSELKRAHEAFAKGAASENEMLRYEADAKEAAAAVAATQAKITGTKLDLEYARITAPFDGRIQDTLINVGNLVTAGESELTTLVQVDPIYAVFNVSREQISRIQATTDRGLVAGSSSPETWKTYAARLVEAGGIEYERAGALNFVGSQIDSTTDMLTARAVFPNPDDGSRGPALIPGQYARIRLALGTQHDALLVPETAVVETQAGTHVFVVTKENKVEMRAVVLGTAFDHRYVVTHGVKAGERVVTEGVQKVRDGMTVEVVPGPS